VVPLEGDGENVFINFSETQSQARDIHELKKKVRSTGSLLDRKSARKGRLFTEEKLYETGARL
jgi:hypothetical protein